MNSRSASPCPRAVKPEGANEGAEHYTGALAGGLRSPCHVGHVWSWCGRAPATSCKAYGSVMVTVSLRFLLKNLPRDLSLEFLLPVSVVCRLLEL